MTHLMHGEQVGEGSAMHAHKYIRAPDDGKGVHEMVPEVSRYDIYVVPLSASNAGCQGCNHSRSTEPPRRCPTVNGELGQASGANSSRSDVAPDEGFNFGFIENRASRAWLPTCQRHEGLAASAAPSTACMHRTTLFETGLSRVAKD